MRFSGFRELVDFGVAEWGDAVALVHGDECAEVTWAAFADLVKARAAELATGARCEAIVADGSLGCVVEVFAANRAGRAVVMLDENHSEQMRLELCAATGSDVLWADGAAKTLNCTRPFLTSAGEMLFFTSGTTSRSKVVVLTDKSLMASAYNGSAVLPLAKSDRLLCMLPLSHVFGFVCGLLWGLSCGATVALGRGPRHYVDDCVHFRPTAVSLVPMLLDFLLGYRLMNPELGLVLVGAGDCSEERLAQVRAQGIRVAFGYGLTETSSGVALAAGDNLRAMAVCPDDTITIAEDGEILVEAPTCMMKGYLGRPEETAEVLRDGVLYTGDLGFIDEAGCLHVTGRKKDILVLPSGTKIFLPDYEAAIRDTLTTDEVAVVLANGKPVLVTAEELGNRDEVLARLAPLMAEQPRSSQLTDVRVLGHKLPRTATGKVKRWEIQKEIDA